MNIKRAFLAATAALMVPGLAMAQITATFPTTVTFTNGDTSSVNATLTCNNGNPLVQSFDISVGNPVSPVVQEIDPAIATCTIEVNDLADGYTSNVCEFGPDEGQTAVSESNACALTASAEGNTYTVNVVWDNDNPDINEGTSIWVNCTNASEAEAGPYTGINGNLGIANGDDYFDLDFYSAPGMTAVCSATASIEDSAVESDEGCSEGTEFSIGSGDAECTITLTVFYEGIPTLSQYGMAIMALLMLGVGFVGFRRFV